MKKKVKIFKQLIKWILISVFSIVLILFLIVYFSSKKIEGYWVNSKYVEYDSNNDSIVGNSNDVFKFKNFNHFDLFRDEKFSHYIFNNKIYVKGIINEENFNQTYNLKFNKNKFILNSIYNEKTNYQWRKKTTYTRIPNSYFNRLTDSISFKKKIFKVIYESHIDTIYFVNNSKFRSKQQKTYRDLGWKRIQNNGLDILFLGIKNDSPYFVYGKNDSIITLKKLDNKEINIQFIEIQKPF